jgi:hypothetical protein
MPYWTDGTNHFPFAKAGTTKKAGGQWNGANCKYKLLNNIATRQQDDLEGPFWFDAGSNQVARSQSEIETYVAGKEATFFKESKGKGLATYSSTQSGDALTKIQTWFA